MAAYQQAQNLISHGQHALGGFLRGGTGDGDLQQSSDAVTFFQLRAAEGAGGFARPDPEGS